MPIDYLNKVGIYLNLSKGLVHLTNWAFVPIVALGFPLKH